MSLKKPSEMDVQARYLRLFNDLRNEVADITDSSLPCFYIHDTSTSGYLKSPTAKIDFTFSANDQVS
jgi:hypothetical protein